MSLFSDAVINFFVNSKDAENSLGGLEKSLTKPSIPFKMD